MVAGPGDSPLGLCTRENSHEMAVLLRPAAILPTRWELGEGDLEQPGRFGVTFQSQMLKEHRLFPARNSC